MGKKARFLNLSSSKKQEAKKLLEEKDSGKMLDFLISNKVIGPVEAKTFKGCSKCRALIPNFIEENTKTIKSPKKKDAKKED